MSSLVERHARVVVRRSVAGEPARVARPVGLGDEQPDAPVPELEQVRDGVAGAALVVDHDRVARNAREPAVDLDDGDAVRGEQLGGVAARPAS